MPSNRSLVTDVQLHSLRLAYQMFQSSTVTVRLSIQLINFHFWVSAYKLERLMLTSNNIWKADVHQGK